MATSLKKIKYNNTDVQVESAIRDGNGNVITTTYATKSEIPTKVSDLTNDSNYITKEVNNLTNYSTTTAMNTAISNHHDSTKQDVINASNKLPVAYVSGLSNVATSGSYNDLSNKPTIPSVYNATVTITQGGVSKGSFTLNQSTNTTIALDSGGSSYTAGMGIDITGNEISVVTSELSYNDLSDLPTIPTVNNPTITFTQGGVSKGSITLNQSSTQTISLDAGGTGGITVQDLLTYVYPVGSVYISWNGTSPASFLGGTWQILGTGYVLMSAVLTYPAPDWNASSRYSGSSTQTLTTSNLPSHRHSMSFTTYGVSGSWYSADDLLTVSKNKSGTTKYTAYTGSGTSFSIMQPSYNVVIYLRTA